MGVELCPECKHPTRVYSDAGHRGHEEGCSLDLGARYLEKMIAPRILTPEDEQKIADVLAKKPTKETND